MSWQANNIAIPFRLGFIQLGSSTVPGITLESHFSTFSADLPDAPPAELLNNQEYQAAFVPSCPLPDDIDTFSRAQQSIRYIPSTYPHYLIRKTTDFSSYFGRHVSKSSRKSLRRALRQFTAASGGSIDWRIYRTADEAAAFNTAAKPLADQTYQAKWLNYSLPSKDILLELASSGAFYGYTLHLEGNVVAFLWCKLIEGNILVQHFGGFDPNYLDLGPGTVLDYLALESAFSDSQISVIDLTQGKGEHKRRFATDRMRCGDVYFFKPTLKNYALVITHFLFQLAYKTAQSILSSLSLLKPLRHRMKQTSGAGSG